MPPRRQNRVAPFEVMRRAAPGAESYRSEDKARESAGDDLAPSAGNGMGLRLWQWLRGSAAPLMLRVPRGLAAVAISGMLGLLVLAYWVGYAQGVDAGKTSVREQLDQQQQAMTRTPPSAYQGMAPGQASDRQQGMLGSDKDATDQANAGQDRAGSAGQSSTARQPGLNYFVLATWPETPARQLAGFFEDRGVAITLEKTDDGRFRVWVVGQGFRSVSSDAYHQYEQRLVQVVNAWNRQDIPGSYIPSDLSARKYQPDR
jgi:hypothetical protein